jgi:murein DD-endopeptidase MepM/ murein hydrolase activator NlpD
MTAAVAVPPRRRLRRAALAVAVTAVLTLLCCGGGLGSFFLSDPTADEESLRASAAGCGERGPVDANRKLPGIGAYGETQIRNAAIIINVGAEMGVGPRGWVIAVATAMQESALSNLPHLGPRNDHDSVGLFQQRPSQGWGSPQQLQDPAYASRKFYAKLLTVRGWQRMPLTRAAQQVQRSAYPDAYAKHEPTAIQIVNLLANGAARAAADSNVLTGGAANGNAMRCAAPGEIAASGWTAPVRGYVTSGFRTPSRPDHDGVDLAAARHVPIRAAAGGQVITAGCDGDNSGQRCRRDGSISTPGCGWYVKVLHAGGIVTMYCHMVYRPQVTEGQTVAAGDVLGQVGTSGHSSGVHLHFEVHDPGQGGPVNPITFMQERGAPLGANG